MKVSESDFLKSQRKTGLTDFVAKKMANDAILAKKPKENEPPVTFVLSATGGEIHRGESVVDRISKPETLKQKIARFERLAQRVRQSRESLFLAMQESIPDGEDPADDFEFEDGDVIDDFGDKIEVPTVKPSVDPTLSDEPIEHPEDVPVDKPTGDPVEPDPASDPK